MKKAAVLLSLTLAFAFPVLGDEEDRHQSHLSYDDGGTIVRSGEDGKDIEAHRNLPIYPGDEVVTSRRGRAEVRLSDGNILGIDRATSLRFRSIIDSYEGDADETVVELSYGKVAVHRTDLGRDHVRLDTERASYVAEEEAVYSVETDSRGRDRVMVFDGRIDVRTPSRAMRLRAGEAATIDSNGVYERLGDQRQAADDFESWFLRRAERFGSYRSEHLDRRLAYWSDDLDQHGRWVYVTGIGYSWRPYVAVGWRPYYNGYWHRRNGGLIWVSHDPWGWGTYHYGRWAYDPGYGWVWVPGSGYSPAWVYWMYGSDYFGWAPAGWWDCYRPYYDWAYNPYRHASARFGFGFYGRVRLNDFDLRPWTFLDSRTIVSTRVDRAALTTDAVKQRFGRSRDGYTTVGGGPARFTREEWNDPAEAVRRRGLDGRYTGRESGAPATDMTPYFRRNGEVSGTVRDRVIRARGGQPGPSGSSSGTAAAVPSRAIGGSTGSVAPIGRGSVAPIGRGSVAPVGSGSSTSGRRNGEPSGGTVGRGATPPSSAPTTTRPADRGSSPGAVDRRPGRGRAAEPPPAPSTGANPSDSGRSQRRDGDGASWRSRPPGNDTSGGSAPGSASSGNAAGSRGSTATGSSSEVPRRVIDRIGGARIYPRGSTGTSTRSAAPREGRSTSARSDDRGSRSTGSSTRSRSSSGRSSGSSTGSSTRSSSGSSNSGSSTRSSSGNSSRSSEGGSRVKRD